MCYKFVYTDDKGKSREVTEKEFEEFKTKYPAMASFLEDPDTYVSEEIILRARDKVKTPYNYTNNKDIFILY